MTVFDLRFDMKILISGSTGLVGTALVSALTARGDEVVRLVRSAAKNASKELISWNPEAGQIDAAALDGMEAVVHLAGENIAAGRWTAQRKARIRSSRVDGTRLLCEALARAPRRPATLVCASAIGFYGSRGDEILTEKSSSGNDFLAEVCRDWEAACEPARAAGIRVVSLRMGMVLSASGGALQKMLLPFKLGLGGILGNGKQYMSWIELDDLCAAIAHLITDSSQAGPVNGVSPQPVTNHEFTKTMGRVLRRPTILPMPAFAARLAFGEMADALLLSSARVLPEKLQASGFRFGQPALEGALRHTLAQR
jgi:uncharacterized protein